MGSLLILRVPLFHLLMLSFLGINLWSSDLALAANKVFSRSPVCCFCPPLCFSSAVHLPVNTLFATILKSHSQLFPNCATLWSFLFIAGGPWLTKAQATATFASGDSGSMAVYCQKCLHDPVSKSCRAFIFSLPYSSLIFEPSRGHLQTCQQRCAGGKRPPHTFNGVAIPVWVN